MTRLSVNNSDCAATSIRDLPGTAPSSGGDKSGEDALKRWPQPRCGGVDGGGETQEKTFLERLLRISDGDDDVGFHGNGETAASDTSSSPGNNGKTTTTRGRHHGGERFGAWRDGADGCLMTLLLQSRDHLAETASGKRKSRQRYRARVDAAAAARRNCEAENFKFEFYNDHSSYLQQYKKFHSCTGLIVRARGG